MKKLFIYFSIIFIFVQCNLNKKIQYRFIGSYAYVITNDSLFKNYSYLTPDSYGYVIGDLNFDSNGIKIINTENLDKNAEYIFTMNHPIKQVRLDSQRIRGEGQEHLKKKPIDIELDQSITTDSIYIYKLNNKGKYRLMLP